MRLKKKAFIGNMFKGEEKSADKKQEIINKMQSGTEDEIIDLIDEYDNLKDKEILTNAIIHSHNDVVGFLLEHGAGELINEKIEYGMTPLILLINNVESNYLPIFNTLIEYGADLLTTDENGNTPLHCAVEKNNPNMIASIANLSKNMDELLNIKNNDGETAVDVAKKNNLKEIVNYLNKIKNEKKPIDFFEQKMKRLKKKLTPSQYRELKEDYEDLRDENLGIFEEDEGKGFEKIKNKMLKKLVDMGILEETYEYYDEEK